MSQKCSNFYFRIKLITYDTISKKIDAIVEGFYSVVDNKVLSIFTVDEFDFILSGQMDIDLEDWKKNTIYKGHFNPNHKVIF